MILLAHSEGPVQTADVQADLGLCCSHMPDDTFLHDVALMIIMLKFHIPAFAKKIRGIHIVFQSSKLCMKQTYKILAKQKIE